MTKTMNKTEGRGNTAFSIKRRNIMYYKVLVRRTSFSYINVKADSPSEAKTKAVNACADKKFMWGHNEFESMTARPMDDFLSEFVDEDGNYPF